MFSSDTCKKIGRYCFLTLIVGVLMALPIPSHADEEKAEDLIEKLCSNCHRLEGKPDSKFKLKAPDLMWGGDKYQRSWLLSYLQGKEERIYPNGYRWDQPSAAFKHPILNEKQSEKIAQYFEKNLKDPRVKKDPIDLSQLTERERDFGADIFKQYSCIGCHQIQEEGKLVGGPISANLHQSGKRYNIDWLFRFALNPQDFTPHSGEYLADLSPIGLRHLLGYLMTLGVGNYKYGEPWKSSEFAEASASRGAGIYKTYCTQCHGMKGGGDGPGAKGLEPKPAVHAKMALSDMPIDYLYNVVYYGGKSVGKSSSMPDWGLTLPTQDLADVIAFLRTNFKGEKKTASAKPGAVVAKASGDCPQKRKTKKAPGNFLRLKNKVKKTAANIKAGEKLFLKDAKPLACMQCHGKTANGKGALAGGLKPKPRNFTCAKTMNEISDGQLFWIIKKGSPGTGMAAFGKSLKDDQIWKLVHYIRSRSN